jgi:hypothetical protein
MRLAWALPAPLRRASPSSSNSDFSQPHITFTHIQKKPQKGLFLYMAEGMRFELTIRMKPYNRLAICRLQPLGHPSTLADTSATAEGSILFASVFRPLALAASRPPLRRSYNCSRFGLLTYAMSLTSYDD